MDFLKELGINLINGIIPILLTALLGIVSTATTYIVFKVREFFNSKTKKEYANIVVNAIEQTVKDSHGEEKFNIAKTKLLEMLSQKGIKISDIEIEMLIENAVKSYNDIKKELQ